LIPKSSVIRILS